jgi:predicted RNase H-like nuclease (RuvC/YqgF family)
MEIQVKSLPDSQVAPPEEGCSLEKIPIEALLKLTRREIGELNSYIDELEYKVQKLEEEIKERDSATPEEIKEFRKSSFYKEMNEKFKELSKVAKEKNIIIANLRKDNEKLLCSKLSNCRECISKRLNNKRQIKALDSKTNSSHNVIRIDYHDNVVIMEHNEFGIIKRTVDEVKFFV